jgi:glucokinase
MVVEMNNEYAVGVDFGGTNLRAAVCDSAGKVFSFVKVKTPPSKPAPNVIETICNIVEQAIIESNIDRGRILGIGVGACGLVDREKGLFKESVIMPTWDNVPLGKHISTYFNMTTVIDNDANAAIYGEWWQGVGARQQHVIGMTLGTGVGGGAILNGRLYYGSTYNSAEFGHITVAENGPQCGCGNKGCLTIMAGAKAIADNYANRLRSKKPQPRSINAGDDKSILTAKDVHEAAIYGDSDACEVILQTGKYLAKATAILINCFNPNIIVFTGGLTNIGAMLLTTIRDEIGNTLYPSLRQATRIEFGKLGSHAGVIGAAALFFQDFQEKQ